MDASVSANPRIRRGITLVELSVTIVVLALLVSLTLVGVQAARESSRRIQCQNKIRQLSMAVASFESQQKSFPHANSDQGGFLNVILPFMENEPLYRFALEHIQSRKSEESFGLRFSGFLCPSDSAVHPSNSTPMLGAASNYTGSTGTWAGSAKAFDGIFVWNFDFGFGSATVRQSDVTDGLSNTSCLSEGLRADGSFHRMRVVWNLPSAHREPQKLSEACNLVPHNARNYGWQGNPYTRGIPWISGNITVTLHNHVGKPNTPSCYNKVNVPTAMASVSSLHGRGVNLAMADGSLRFVDDSIDSIVWFAFGSRNGAETLGAE